MKLTAERNSSLEGSHRALETNRERASLVMSSLEGSEDFSRNPLAAYAISILHKSLERDFFESDDQQKEKLTPEEIDELRSYYPRRIEASIRCFVIDRLHTAQHIFSDQEQHEIERLIALFQRNAREIVRVEGVVDQDAIRIRTWTAVNFLASSLAKLAKIAKG